VSRHEARGSFRGKIGWPRVRRAVSGKEIARSLQKKRECTGEGIKERSDSRSRKKRRGRTAGGHPSRFLDTSSEDPCANLLGARSSSNKESSTTSARSGERTTITGKRGLGCARVIVPKEVAERSCDQVKWDTVPRNTRDSENTWDRLKT